MRNQASSRLTEPQPSNRSAQRRSTRTGRKEQERAESASHSGNPRFVVALLRKRPLTEAQRVLLATVDEVLIGRGDLTQIGEPTGRRVSITIEDDEMSRQHAKLGHVPGGWELEDTGSKNRVHVNGNPIRKRILSDGDTVEMGSTIFLFRQDGRPRSFAPIERDSMLTALLMAFPTLSLELELKLRRLARIVRTRESVLVCGSSGTGKERIANTVHALSGRPGPICTFNCAGPPASLIASELFGYVRGAFTGATENHIGLVRKADRGTLFLDEVGDMPSEVQGTLLRVLQEREVAPLGDSGSPTPVDLRVVAATNRELKTMIHEGKFRRDLYQRLAGFELPLSPLRERREDIGLFIAMILRGMGDDATGVTLHQDVARILLGYDYPGNVRELESILRSAVHVAGVGGEIQKDDLPEELWRYQWPMSGDRQLKKQIIRDRLIATLSEADGVVAEVARRMQKAPVQIYRWIEEFGIDLQEFRQG